MRTIIQTYRRKIPRHKSRGKRYYLLLSSASNYPPCRNLQHSFKINNNLHSLHPFQFSFHISKTNTQRAQPTLRQGIRKSTFNKRTQRPYIYVRSLIIKLLNRRLADRLRPLLSGTNTIALLQRHHKNLAVTDISGTGSLDDRINGCLHKIRVNGNFNSYLF